MYMEQKPGRKTNINRAKTNVNGAKTNIKGAKTNVNGAKPISRAQNQYQ